MDKKDLNGCHFRSCFTDYFEYIFSVYVLTSHLHDQMISFNLNKYFWWGFILVLGSVHFDFRQFFVICLILLGGGVWV